MNVSKAAVEIDRLASLAQVLVFDLKTTTKNSEHGLLRSKSRTMLIVYKYALHM